MDVETPGEKDESFISAHSSLPLSPEPQQDEGLRLEEEDTGMSNATSNDHFDVTTPPRRPDLGAYFGLCYSLAPPTRPA